MSRLQWQMRAGRNTTSAPLNYIRDKIYLRGVFMTICIFPGTFNPIHDGHIKMAEYALQKYNFEKIIFIPAYFPPHKEVSLNLAKHRYKMVELAIQNNPKFEVSNI